MSELRQSRCFHHAQREAAAICPSCQRHYCRECVTFVDGKMSCASCLQEEEGESKTKIRPHWGAVGEKLAFVIAFLFLWASFAILGKVMSSIPDEVHDASYWEGLSESP